MAWRFTDPKTPPEAAAGPSPHLRFDTRLARWRWDFAGHLERAQQRVGRDLTPAEAAAAVGPEVALALSHIEASPPDQTVFGSIYEQGAAGRRLPVDARKAAESRKHAEAVSAKALSGSTPDFMREGLYLGAVEVLYDILKHHNPNDLEAAGGLARFLHLSRQNLAAMAEWADRYCRAASAASVFRRIPQTADPVRAGVAAAFHDSLTKLLVTSLSSDAQLLEASTLFKPERLSGMPLRASTLESVAEYVRSTANWLNLVCQTKGHMAFYQLGTGTIQRVRTAVQTLLRVWRESHLEVYPPSMKQVMIECATALVQILDKELPYKQTELRVAACRAMGDIPLFETIHLLQARMEHHDPVVKREIGEAIRQAGVGMGIG
jgi:hypothetical protein